MVYLSAYEQAVLDTLFAERLPHGLDYLQPEFKLLSRMRHHDPTLPHDSFVNYINYIRAEILAYITSEEGKAVIDGKAAAELFRLLIFLSAALPLNAGAPSIHDPQRYVYLCHHDGSELSEDNLAISVKGYWYNKANLFNAPGESLKAKYIRLKNHFSDLEIELNFGIKTPIEVPVDSERFTNIQTKWLKKKKFTFLPWLMSACFVIASSPWAIFAAVTMFPLIFPVVGVISLLAIVIYKRFNAFRIFVCYDWANNEYQKWQKDVLRQSQEQQLLSTLQVNDVSNVRDVIMLHREQDRQRNHLNEGQINPPAYQFAHYGNVPPGEPHHANAILPAVNQDGEGQKPIPADENLPAVNQEAVEQKPVPVNVILQAANQEGAEERADAQAEEQEEEKVISIALNRYSSFASSPPVDGGEKVERSGNYSIHRPAI